MYDLITGEIVKQWEGHEGIVRDVNWHPYLPEVVVPGVQSFFTFSEISVGRKTLALVHVSAPFLIFLSFRG